jgi:GntR family transcriptional repressor for pyruvate dehydrogenase complex
LTRPTPDDRSAQVAADVAFHLTIAESAHNALFGHLVASVLRLLHEHVRRSLREIAVSPETGRQLMAQHLAIRDAIRAREPDAARLAAQTHINYRPPAPRATPRDSRKGSSARLRHFS